MLADALIEEQELVQGLGRGHARFVEDLRRAHRFELSNEFAAATDELARSSVVALAKVFPLARLPYPVCWIETLFDARMAFATGQDLGEMFHKGISRVGILIKDMGEDGRLWRCHLGWTFKGGAASLSPYGLEFDLRDDPERNGRVDPGDFEDGKRKRAEAEGLYDLESRGTPFVSDYHGELFAKVNDASMLQNLHRMGIGDWMGEPPFWAAAVALINSRNVTSIEAGPDFTKLSKARVKKGRPPLLDYSICKLAPKLIARSGRGEGGTGSGVRAHFVRGHFKVRQTGIYWWTPHVRGDAGEGFVRKHYDVR